MSDSYTWFKGFYQRPATQEELTKRFENGLKYATKICIPDEPTEPESIGETTSIGRNLALACQDPPIQPSDTDYSNLSLDEKILSVIETVCYRIDHCPEDADLTCINMQFFHFKDCASSLKICVEQFCSTLRRDLTDGRTALRNAEHIMNSFHKYGKQLIFTKGGVYVEGDPQPSSWITSTFKDCMKYKPRFDKLDGMVRELAVSTGYYIEFHQNLMTLETPQLIDKNIKLKVIDTIYIGLPKIVERLKQERQHLAAFFLEELRKMVLAFYEPKKFVTEFDVLSLFADGCYNNFGQLIKNPSGAIVALKQIKKFTCTYDRYYKLYDLLDNIRNYGCEGYDMLEKYRKYKGDHASQEISNKTDWSKLHSDLVKLQQLTGEVCQRWKNFYEYWLLATIHYSTTPRQLYYPGLTRSLLQQSHHASLTPINQSNSHEHEDTTILLRRILDYYVSQCRHPDRCAFAYCNFYDPKYASFNLDIKLD